jgi:16S rRNA (guanine966-N2)-methyltransferase
MRPPKEITKSSKATKSKLRIIGGEWRSRTLPIPEVEALRPTPDRVRETLFNWVSVWVPGAHCGDLFCGSGALGLEALSRGASSCLFVDNSRVVTQQMKANLATLKTSAGKVIQQNALDLLKTQPSKPFDIVFLDPPFRKGWLEELIPLLNNQWLANRAWVYIEMEKESNLPETPSNWALVKEKSAGQLCYRLFEVNKTE